MVLTLTLAFLLYDTLQYLDILVTTVDRSKGLLTFINKDAASESVIPNLGI